MLIQVLAFSRYPFSTAHVVIRIFKTLLCFFQLLIASQQLTSRCQVHYYFNHFKLNVNWKILHMWALFPKCIVWLIYRKPINPGHSHRLSGLILFVIINLIQYISTLWYYNISFDCFSPACNSRSQTGIAQFHQFSFMIDRKCYSLHIHYTLSCISLLSASTMFQQSK